MLVHIITDFREVLVTSKPAPGLWEEYILNSFFSIFNIFAEALIEDDLEQMDILSKNADAIGGHRTTDTSAVS